MATEMLESVQLADGPPGLLADRSTTPDTRNRVYANAVPMEQALQRDAEQLANTPLTSASGQRAACAQLAGISQGLEFVGTTINVRPGIANVVQASIVRIERIARDVQAAVADGRPPTGDVAALRRQIAALERERDQLLDQLEAPGDATTIAQLERQLDIQSRTIAQLESEQQQFTNQLEAAADRAEQLSAENQSLRQRLEASQQEVERLRAGRPRPQPTPEPAGIPPDQGPAESSVTEAPGPTPGDVEAAIDDILYFRADRPLGQNPAIRAEDVADARLPAFAVQTGKAFVVPDRPGPTVTNMDGADDTVRWRTAFVGYTPGDILTITAWGSPFRGTPPRPLRGLYGFLIGMSAFVRITFASGRDPVNLAISKEQGAHLTQRAVRPTANQPWKSDLTLDLQYTPAPEEGEPETFADTIILGARTAGVPSAQDVELFGTDVLPDENSPAAQIFLTDTDWSSVTANVTRVYVVEDSLERARQAFADYTRMLDQDVSTALATGTSWAAVQDIKKKRLLDMIRQEKVVYVTDQGIVGTLAQTTSEELEPVPVARPEDPAPVAAGEHVSWANDDEEFKDW